LERPAGTRIMDTQSYLKRIGYRGSVRPSIDVLRRLHVRHLLSVPFENLDIHLSRPIILDQELFYNKIVRDRRGGYCYELNGCFAWLLRELGFRVSMLSARVAGKNGGFSPDLDHMTLLVRLKEPWLVDVGFGDSFTEPKRLDSSGSQLDNRELYRIAKKNREWVLSRWDEIGLWNPQYSFKLRARKLADFNTRNRYQQSSPKSHFTQGRLISKLTPRGRVTLSDRKFVVTSGGRREENPVKNSKQFDRLLERYFHLSFD
jgi:N-hydroxyarylamine O-acetyltransferase